MNKKLTNILALMASLALAAAFAPAYAEHGTLSSNERENWINSDLNQLVAEGFLPAPSKPIVSMTNLEAAQMTAKAGEIILAQADLPPALPGGDMTLPPPSLPEPGLSSPLPGANLPLPAANPMLPGLPSPAAAKGVSQLVEEFRAELAAMGEDLPQLEDRIYALEHRNDSLAEQQQELLKRTGTEGSGFSRGYFNSYRGFGISAPYQTTNYNSLIFMDMRLKSVPAPFILFDTTIRFWRTIGMYYADPLMTSNPGKVDLRWISLSSFNEYATFTAGDFFQHYTPLTLWNYEVPVYTLVEPTSYYRNRKDVEEIAFMDHGPNYRLRGIQASTGMASPDDAVLGILKAQVMAGPIKGATQYGFGDYFAGSQASMSFFSDDLEFKGAGLLIWDDPGTASVPYNPNFPQSFAKQYQVGSFSTRVKIPFDSDVSLTASGEYAGSIYQDDINNPQRVFQDWALLYNGALNISGFHLTAKYLDIGPYYYSPGAQTNRYTPEFTGGTNVLDNALNAYPTNFVFNSLGRPSYLPYDRIAENILPYGDSTPNRKGLELGLDLQIGQHAWLHPQVVLYPSISGLQMQEDQPNYVLSNAGTGGVAVDTQTSLGAMRTFSGFETALTMDLAKAFDLKEKIYQIAFDYKNQSTALSGLPTPFNVDTLIGAVDFNLPVAGFDTVVLSASLEQAKSTGSEYVLSGLGNPPSLASYSFYLDSSTLGQYALTPLNMTETSWAFGFKYPLSKTLSLRADVFLNQYTWADVPAYTRNDQILRFTYEAHF